MTDGNGDALLREIQVLDIEQVRANEYNPNEMTPQMLADVVEDIQQRGFAGAITVRPDPEQEGAFVVIDGEHRLEAARRLSMKQIPAVVVELSDDEARVQTVRWNALRGEPDPVKFLELWNELLKRHDAEVLRAKMGLTRARLKSYLPKVIRNLPDEIRAKVDEQLDDIETVEDLMEIVRQAMVENKPHKGTNHFVIRVSDAKLCWIQVDDSQYRDITVALGRAAIKTSCWSG